MHLELRDDLRGYFSVGEPFGEVMGLEGEPLRRRPDRVTLRCSLAGKAYVVKLHYGIGWNEIFKNLVCGRLPVLSAMHEWRAIRRLRQVGLPTVEVAGVGEEGWNPAKRRSFLITEALPETCTLEELTQSWRDQPPPFQLKHRLIRRVAEMTRSLHDAGMNHRDLYLCHFRLPRAYLKGSRQIEPPLVLMDLHRAQIRRRVPRRWLLKDLGALCFSSADIGLTQRDRWRFIRYYERCSLRAALRHRGAFWKRVAQRGEKFRRRIRD